LDPAPEPKRIRINSDPDFSDFDIKDFTIVKNVDFGMEIPFSTDFKVSINILAHEILVLNRENSSFAT